MTPCQKRDPGFAFTKLLRLATPTLKKEDTSGRETDKKIARVPARHIFHRSCIKKWAKHHDECPLCKRKVDI